MRRKTRFSVQISRVIIEWKPDRKVYFNPDQWYFSLTHTIEFIRKKKCMNSIVWEQLVSTDIEGNATNPIKITESRVGKRECVLRAFSKKERKTKACRGEKTREATLCGLP